MKKILALFTFTTIFSSALIALESNVLRQDFKLDSAKNQDSNKNSNIEITDFLGNKSTFQNPAKSHIFLSFCEVVPMLESWDSALGLSQHVFNEPIFKKTNKNLDSIPKVGGGSGSSLNIEVLKKLNPDVVVVWAGKKKEINFIRNNGIKILAFYPNNINEVFRDINTISKALGKEDLVKKKMKSTLELLKIVESKTKNLEHKKSAIYLWDKPNRIAGNKGMIADMLERIGVINLGGNLNVDSAEISIEKLISLNPNIIFIWGAAKFSESDILNNPQFKNIKAIKNKAVYKMPLWDNWGPRIAQTTLLSASLAYKNEYSDINIDSLIERSNKDLFGIDVR